MKTSNKTKLILLVITFFIATACVHAYPPDNAALLYYKVAVLYEVDDEMADTLAMLQKGEVEINDKIREFVNKNRKIINTVLDASEVENCDWAMDLSQGLEMDMPPLGAMRKLARLVIADTKILSENGDYQTAVSRCMSLYRIVRHVNDRIYINYLMAIAINALTNDCLIEVIGDMPQDVENLTHLKDELVKVESIPFSVMPSVLGEREAVLMFMTKKNMADVVRLCGEMDEVKKKMLLSADDDFMESNRQYLENYYSKVIEAFNMSYIQGYAAFKELGEKLENDVKSNPDATLTGILAPRADKIFSLMTRFNTHNNAMKTAIEVYLIKAKTGKLPDTLSKGLPGDMFSNKPFAYEKTAGGFILRCQGKDLSKDEIYEYEFEVKK